MQLSKMETISTIVSLLIIIISGAVYIGVLRDDVNDLSGDIKELKSKETERSKQFNILKKELVKKIDNQIKILNKEKKEFSIIKGKLEKKIKDKKTNDIFLARELLDDAIKSFNNKSYRLSISKLEKVLEINKDDTDALFYLSKSYEKIGEKAKAFDFIKKAYSLNSNREDILSEIGLAYEHRGIYKRAIEYFGKLNDIAPGRQTTLYRLSYNFRKLGNYEKALFYANEYMKIDENYSGYDLRGTVLYKLKEYKKAIIDLTKAKDIGEEQGYYIDSFVQMIRKSKEILLRNKK